MASKYVDTHAIILVIGSVYKNPGLLDFTDRYTLNDEDFPEPFHRVVFGVIYKLHELGVQKITLTAINDYLVSRPKSAGIFQAQNGDEWLLKVVQICTPSAFDYYYNRLKKFTLLRGYDAYGINVTDIYDPDTILDSKKRLAQEDKLDNMSLIQIADEILKKIDLLRALYIDNDTNEAQLAGNGIFDLIERYKKIPEIGVPLYGSLINTITRGARLKKFYLRSAATGVGKTRSMIADACYIGCSKIYDESFGWIKTGLPQPTLYIATELDLSEIQTMMLAFLSNVDEAHIIDGRYEGDEEERVKEAGKILLESPLYVEELPDFSLLDLENVIKRNIRDHDVRYVFMDYIHTSMKILEEITRRSGGVRLREDNILFMLSNKLKDICNTYGIFIMSATLLNMDYQTSDTPDLNLLRGAKSIADKIDFGAIMLLVKEDDKKGLEQILNHSNFEVPSIKISIYKNRRARYKGIYLWCKADLGVCRIQPMFATRWDYELIPINDTQINVTSAFPADDDED